MPDNQKNSIYRTKWSQDANMKRYADVSKNSAPQPLQPQKLPQTFIFSELDENNNQKTLQFNNPLALNDYISRRYEESMKTPNATPQYFYYNTLPEYGTEATPLYISDGRHRYQPNAENQTSTANIPHHSGLENIAYAEPIDLPLSSMMALHEQMARDQQSIKTLTQQNGHFNSPLFNPLQASEPAPNIESFTNYRFY